MAITFASLSICCVCFFHDVNCSRLVFHQFKQLRVDCVSSFFVLRARKLLVLLISCCNCEFGIYLKSMKRFNKLGFNFKKNEEENGEKNTKPSARPIIAWQHFTVTLILCANTFSDSVLFGVSLFSAIGRIPLWSTCIVFPHRIKWIAWTSLCTYAIFLLHALALGYLIIYLSIYLCICCFSSLTSRLHFLPFVMHARAHTYARSP